MISAVSGISFRGTTESDFQQLIQSEGKYSQKSAATAPVSQVVPEAPAKGKNKAGKIIGGTLAAIVIAGLALFGLKRGDVIKIDKEAKGFGKLTSKLAEAGEWIGTKMIDPLCNIFKKKKAADVADVTEKTTEEVSKIFA